MKKIKIGQIFTIRRKFSLDEVTQFSTICGDLNPIHTDVEYCRTNSRFGKPIIHGILGASLFSNLLGNNIIGSIYMSQSLKFVRPIYVDEEIEARIIIKEANIERRHLVLKTQLIKDNDIIATDGDAVIKYPAEYEIEK